MKAAVRTETDKGEKKKSKNLTARHGNNVF